MVNFIVVIRKHRLLSDSTFLNAFFLLLNFNTAVFAKQIEQLVNTNYISKDLCLLRGKGID